MQSLRDENRRRLSRIQSEVCRRRRIVDDANPAGLPKVLDARCRRPFLDRLIPDGFWYDDITKERSKDVEKADARQIDERRAVGDDEHELRSASGLRNSRELSLEVLDVVVDGLKAVSTRFDEKLVERHVECPSRSCAGQTACSHFVDHEQQPRAHRQLLGRPIRQRARNRDGYLHEDHCSRYRRLRARGRLHAGFQAAETQ